VGGSRITGATSAHALSEPNVAIHRAAGTSYAPCDFGSMFTLDHRDVVLALQIKPELRAVSETTAESHCSIDSNRPAQVELSEIRPDGRRGRARADSR